MFFAHLGVLRLVAAFFVASLCPTRERVTRQVGGSFFLVVIMLGAIVGHKTARTAAGCLLGVVCGFNGALALSVLPVVSETVQFSMDSDAAIYLSQCVLAIFGATIGGYLGGRVARSTANATRDAKRVVRRTVVLAMTPTVCAVFWLSFGRAEMIVYVTNQSPVTDPVAIEVIIDGERRISGNFPLGSEFDVGGHTYYKSVIVVKPGKHRISARTEDGRVQVDETVLVLFPRQLIILSYWHYLPGHPYGPVPPEIMLKTKLTRLIIV